MSWGQRLAQIYNKDWESASRASECAANDFVSKFHERKPVLLQQKDFDRWLTGNAGTELLQRAAKDLLQTWPVSKRVNSSRAPDDDPALIDNIDKDPMPTNDPEALMAWANVTFKASEQNAGTKWPRSN